MNAGYLVLFAKEPRMGRVKTRLARDIGTVGAWSFYRRSLIRLARDLGRDPRWRTVLAVAPDTSLNAPCWPECDFFVPQGRGGLGQRMQRVFDGMPPGPVVIVGADIPGVEKHHIRSAFMALGQSDAVIGPADDGGYWLIGLKRRPRIPHIFDGVRWSGPHAMADTLQNMRGLGVARLDTLIDVDTGSDLKRLQSKA